MKYKGKYYRQHKRTHTQKVHKFPFFIIGELMDAKWILVLVVVSAVVGGFWVLQNQQPINQEIVVNEANSRIIFVDAMSGLKIKEPIYAIVQIGNEEVFSGNVVGGELKLKDNVGKSARVKAELSTYNKLDEDVKLKTKTIVGLKKQLFGNSFWAGIDPVNHIKVRVLDYVGRRIAGANVQLKSTRGLISSGKTNNKGYVEFDVNGAGELTIIVNKSGYVDSVYPLNFGDEDVTIRLAKIENKYNVEFELPVSGSVSLYRRGEFIGNKEGKVVEFSVNKGKYRYVASAEGYLPGEGVIDINEDKYVSVELPKGSNKFTEICTNTKGFEYYVYVDGSLVKKGKSTKKCWKVGYDLFDYVVSAKGYFAAHGTKKVEDGEFIDENTRRILVNLKSIDQKNSVFVCLRTNKGEVEGSAQLLDEKGKPAYKPLRVKGCVELKDVNPEDRLYAKGSYEYGEGVSRIGEGRDYNLDVKIENYEKEVCVNGIDVARNKKVDVHVIFDGNVGKFEGENCTNVKLDNEYSMVVSKDGYLTKMEHIYITKGESFDVGMIPRDLNKLGVTYLRTVREDGVEVASVKNIGGYTDYVCTGECTHKVVWPLRHKASFEIVNPVGMGVAEITFWTNEGYVKDYGFTNVNVDGEYSFGEYIKDGVVQGEGRRNGEIVNWIKVKKAFEKKGSSTIELEFIPPKNGKMKIHYKMKFESVDQNENVVEYEVDTVKNKKCTKSNGEELCLAIGFDVPGARIGKSGIELPISQRGFINARIMYNGQESSGKLYLTTDKMFFKSTGGVFEETEKDIGEYIKSGVYDANEEIKMDGIVGMGNVTAVADRSIAQVMEVKVGFKAYGSYSARIEAKAKKNGWVDLENGMKLGDVSALKVTVCDVNLGGCAIKEPVTIKMEGCAGQCDINGAFGTILEKQTKLGVVVFKKKDILDALSDFDSDVVGNEVWIRFSASSTSYQKVKTKAWKFRVLRDMVSAYSMGSVTNPISVSEELKTDDNVYVNVCDEYGIKSLYLKQKEINAGEVEFGFESMKSMSVVQIANINSEGDTESYCYGDCRIKTYPLESGVTIVNVDVNLGDSISEEEYVGDLIIKPKDVETLDEGAGIRLHIWAKPSLDCVDSMPKATKTNIIVRRGVSG